MMHLALTLNIDEKPWKDCKDVPTGMIERMARVPGGTAAGFSAIAICIRLADGTLVVGQTTMVLLENAVVAFKEADERARKLN